MFRETTTDTQMSLFDNPADLMGKRAVKKYEDPKAWFNQFYELVTSQIDESVFKPLFKEGNMGAPTASIRLEDEAPSLITGVQVEGATAADNRALSVNGVFTGIQGRQSRYLLDESDGDTVRITDTRTGEVHEAKRTRSGALRIPYPGDRSKYKWRYFLPKQLESMRSRKQMEDIPQEEKNKRNNVEASIFQLCFHTRSNKTRYRGKRKHELWAFARSAWINLRRILLFQGKNAPEGITGAHNGTLSSLMALLNAMSQTCVHLKLYFSGPGFRPAMVTAGLKY